MKYITLIIGLLVVGCLKQEQTNQKQIVTKNTNEASEPLPAKPPPPPVMPNPFKDKDAKDLTLEEKVVGTYEVKGVGGALRIVLPENGVGEEYDIGKTRPAKGKWSISKEGEIHIVGGGRVFVYRINKDKSITIIAIIHRDGKRTAHPDGQYTLKKIK